MAWLSMAMASWDRQASKDGLPACCVPHGDHREGDPSAGTAKQKLKWVWGVNAGEEAGGGHGQISGV